MRPAAAVIASCDQKLGKRLLATFSNAYFSTYCSDDVIGVQLCGAIKNVIAIAAGIVQGLELGDNAHAAIISKGVSEIVDIVLKMGGSMQTVMGLAGVGDLFLTCSSPKSRNRAFGYQLAFDRNIQPPGLGHLVEGYYTAAALYQLCKQLNISMPVSSRVYNILYGSAEVQTIVAAISNNS